MKYIFLVFLAGPAFAANYVCTTQVGETVAIRKIVLKSNSLCPTCSDPSTTIPDELIDQMNSEDWTVNSYVKDIPGLTTKFKRRPFTSMGRSVFLETRYVHQDFNTFDFQLACKPGNDPEWPGTPHCEGSFKSLDKDKVAADLPSFDKRADRKTRVEITLGHKPHLGFIVRLTKDSVLPNGRQSRISSSGEMKFFSEENLFIQDVAVNEPMPILGQDIFDREAVEIKIICRKTPARP